MHVTMMSLRLMTVGQLKHILTAFRRAGIRYAIGPGVLPMYVQAIDVAMVALSREEKHALYVHMVGGGRKVTASACRSTYSHSSYQGVHGSFEAPERSSKRSKT